MHHYGSYVYAWSPAPRLDLLARLPRCPVSPLGTKDFLKVVLSPFFRVIPMITMASKLDLCISYYN